MHTVLLLLLEDIELRYPHGLPKQHFNQIWDEIGSDCIHAGYSFGQVRDLLIQLPTICWDNKRMVYRDKRFWIYLDDCPDAAWYSWAGYIWMLYIGHPELDWENSFNSIPYPSMEWLDKVVELRQQMQIGEPA